MPCGCPGVYAAKLAERVASIAHQISKYPCPLLEVADPARMAEYLGWSHGRNMTRWYGLWRGKSEESKALLALCKKEIAVERAVAKAKRIELGDEPDVGEVLPGYRPVSGVSVEEAEKAPPVVGLVSAPLPACRVTPGAYFAATTSYDDFKSFSAARWAAEAVVADPVVTFTGRNVEPVTRSTGTVRRLRRWYAMKGLQDRMLRGPLLSSGMDLDAVDEAFRALRLRGDMQAALDEWEAMRREEPALHWTVDTLNAWYANEARMSRERMKQVCSTE